MSIPGVTHLGGCVTAAECFSAASPGEQEARTDLSIQHSVLEELPHCHDSPSSQVLLVQKHFSCVQTLLKVKETSFKLEREKKPA